MFATNCHTLHIPHINKIYPQAFQWLRSGEDKKIYVLFCTPRYRAVWMRSGFHPVGLFAFYRSSPRCGGRDFEGVVREGGNWLELNT